MPLGSKDWDNDRVVAFCVAEIERISRTLFRVRIVFITIPTVVIGALSYRMFIA